MTKSKQAYQIDMSGKIEDTARPTVIAITNGETYAILIPAKVKRQLQERYRLEGLRKIYIYDVFSLGIFFVLNFLKDDTTITIDVEYKGKEELITKSVVTFLEVHKKPRHEIKFSRIGNRPKVHYAAHDVFTLKKKADKIISLKEVLKALKKTDGRLRECFPTLVGAQPRSIEKIYHKKEGKAR